MISIPEFFQNNLGLDLAKLEKKEDFLAAARKAGNSSVTDTDGWEDLFFKLVLDEIETRLPHDEISVLTHYPTRVSPLSRPDHSGTYAERFEIYWHGMEIANGCTELWSAEELTRRYQKESQTRIENKKEPHPYPHDLIESAKSPLPLVSGIAIGLERLFYACELSRRL
jgi:lysyl-tRNA synthetase class 2